MQSELSKCLNKENAKEVLLDGLHNIFVFQKEAETLLGDDRFKAMFENPEFQIDEESQEFQLLNPVITRKFEKSKKKAAEDVDNVSDKEEVKMVYDISHRFDTVILM